MDVGCPKCKAEYELDDERVTGEGVTVKCASCAHVFRVKRKQLIVTLPVKGDSPPPTNLDRPSAELPPPPPSREWKLRQSNGHIVPCRDLTMLQKWIIEDKVHRDDEISLTGETWKRLGNIPELASFFQIVEDASKARALEALQRTTPPPPPAPSVPPAPAAPARITDTWKGGVFQMPPSEPLPPPAPSLDVELEPDGVPEPPEPPEPPTRRSEPTRRPSFPISNPTPAPVDTLQGGRFPPFSSTSSVTRKEPSPEELRRAGVSGGGSRWVILVLAGVAIGTAVGWYFGVYEPEQRRLAEEHERIAEEVRAKALAPRDPPPVVTIDAGIEVVDSGAPEVVDAGPAVVIDAGVSAPVVAPVVVDAGTGKSGAAGPPVVVEKKKSFDGIMAQAERLREREKPEEALDLYGKALELRPDHVEPLTGRGLALLDMANPSAAVASFEQALSHAPRYGPAIMGLAEAYRMQGNNPKAIEYYQRYLDVLPNGAEAAVARNSIERLKR